MKYNILHDYGSGGFSFYCGNEESQRKDFDTVGEALIFAMNLGYTSEFTIVTVIDYKKLVLESDLNNPIN